MQATSDRIGLPRIDEVPVSVALTAVGRKLNADYSDVVTEAIPKPLALIADRLGREAVPTNATRMSMRDRRLGFGHLRIKDYRSQGHGVAQKRWSNLALLLISTVGLGYALAWIIRVSKSDFVRNARQPSGYPSEADLSLRGAWNRDH